MEHYLTIRRNIKEINPRGRRRIAEEFARHESCRFSKGDQKHIFELLKDIAGDNGKSFWMNNLRALVEFRASLPKENESKSFTTNSPETSAHHNWDAFDYNSPVELQEAIAREDQIVDGRRRGDINSFLSEVAARVHVADRVNHLDALCHLDFGSRLYCATEFYCSVPKNG